MGQTENGNQYITVQYIALMYSTILLGEKKSCMKKKPSQSLMQNVIQVFCVTQLYWLLFLFHKDTYTLGWYIVTSQNTILLFLLLLLKNSLVTQQVLAALEKSDTANKMCPKARHLVHFVSYDRITHYNMFTDR